MAEESKELWRADSWPIELTALTAKSNSPLPKSECFIESAGCGVAGISARRFHAADPCGRQYARYVDIARGGEGNCIAGGSHSKVIVADDTLIGNQPLDDGRGQPLTQRREMHVSANDKILTIVLHMFARRPSSGSLSSSPSP